MTEDALLAAIVCVIGRRRYDLSRNVVAKQALLPSTQIVRDLWRHIHHKRGGLLPSFRRVTLLTVTRQVVLRAFVTVIAQGSRPFLAFVVTSLARCSLVCTDQCDRVQICRKPDFLEASLTVAVLALGAVVSLTWRLVAT